MVGTPHENADVDEHTATIARVQDTLLGGDANFDSDQARAHELSTAAPEIAGVLESNRAWISRVVRWLAGPAEIDQFLDVGAGMPFTENTHEAAQTARSGSRTVYMDNDALTVQRGTALVADTVGAEYCYGELDQPARVFGNHTVRSTLDLSRPVALLQCMTLHFVPDQDRAEQIMCEYIDALPAGSFVALSHAGTPEDGDDQHDAARMWRAVDTYRAVAPTFTPRSTDQIARLLPGTTLVEPGVVTAATWGATGPLPDRLPYLVRLHRAVVGQKS